MALLTGVVSDRERTLWKAAQVAMEALIALCACRLPLPGYEACANFPDHSTGRYLASVPAAVGGGRNMQEVR